MTVLSLISGACFTALFAKLARNNADEVADVFEKELDFKEKVLKANQEIIHEKDVKIKMLGNEKE